MPPYMVAALAAALDRRARTGEGCRIDAAMYEICVQQMAGAILQAQTGDAPRRLGNRDPAVLLQGVFPTRGDDRWIAIEATDPRLWAELRASMDWDDGPDATALLIADEALLAVVDARIAAWTRAQDGYELMRRLQSIDVPAGVVQDASDLIERDPQLASRDFLVAADNLVLGRFGHQGEPAKLSRTPARLTTAPALGEHTEHVCRQFAGLSGSAFADLAASGLFE
jgi:crotonobetainyl-CoA:carnitine CoA-transferase CaiB-like acyl-CoA transferase